MITRAYQNAKDERQEVTLSAAQWEVLTEAELQEILGFNKPVVAPVVAAAVKVAKRKRR